MREIYETELWKNLAKNEAFLVKFDAVIKSCSYYKKGNVQVRIDGNKLVIDFRSGIMNHENDCQYRDESKYEFFLDDNGNLIVNEMSGTLRTDYGSDFSNAKKGILNTTYTCMAYDETGIELSEQVYMDSYHITNSQGHPKLSIYSNGFMATVEKYYNPNLELHATEVGSFIHPKIIGNEAKFSRVSRSKDNLGLVTKSSCEFRKGAKGSIEMFDQKEEYYFNTFVSLQNMNPLRICYTKGYPFAVSDGKHGMEITEEYSGTRINQENYAEISHIRFLGELQADRTKAPKEALEKYDLIIGILESNEKETGTIK